MQTDVTVAIINSRGNEHPDWVNTAINSVKRSCEIYPVKLIVLDNRERKHTVGYCHNKIVKDADMEWIFFLDDDDWISADLIATCLYHAKKNPKCVVVNSQMTAFTQDGETVAGFGVPRQHKGLVRRKYLLKHPFDETLKNGVDRAWFDQLKMRGDLVIQVPYHYGYYYRQHDEHRARATGNIRFVNDPGDIHFHARQSNFIEPFYNKLKETYNCTLDDRKARPEAMVDAKVIWCEWLDSDALEIAKYETNAAKILRVHAYEAFTDRIFYVDWNDFDHVIFVADHIRKYVEDQIGQRISNAIVVPNGIDLEKFNYLPEKKENNKVCYAGSVERKKGIGELVLVAEHFPFYEFHVAGTYREEDVADFLRKQKPDNLIFHGEVHDMPKFYQDYSYVINTSLREGNPVAVLEAMACGCKPIVRNWVGANDFMNKTWVWRDFAEIDAILESSYDPERYRNWVEQKYNFVNMYDTFKGLIDGAVQSRHKNTG